MFIRKIIKLNNKAIFCDNTFSIQYKILNVSHYWMQKYYWCDKNIDNPMNYIDISFYNLFCVTKTTTENRNNDVFLTHTYQGLYFKNMIICVVNGNLFFWSSWKMSNITCQKRNIACWKYFLLLLCSYWM